MQNYNDFYLFIQLVLEIAEMLISSKNVTTTLHKIIKSLEYKLCFQQK